MAGHTTIESGIEEIEIKIKEKKIEGRKSLSLTGRGSIFAHPRFF